MRRQAAAAASGEAGALCVVPDQALAAAETKALDAAEAATEFEVPQPAPAAAVRRLPTTKLGRVVLNFTPSWFSVNMGVGIVATLLMISPRKLPGMEAGGMALFLVNLALFLTFLAVTVARYTLYPWVLPVMISHSMQSLFVGTLPMGLATLINCATLAAVPRGGGGWAPPLAWSLWWVDSLLSVVSALFLPTVFFHVHNHSLERFTGVWLLPFVPLVVASACGATVAQFLPPHQALVTCVVCMCMWGAGMGLSLLIMATYLGRLIIHRLPPADVIISAFLPLGPLGQGAFAFMRIFLTLRGALREDPSVLGLTAADVDIAVRALHVVAVLVGLAMWGLGVFWLVHGLSAVTYRAATGRIPFSMSWWGLIFPLGVYTSATILLGELLPSSFFTYLSLIFIAALVLLLIGVGSMTLQGAWKGTLFKAPCISEVVAAAEAAEAEADAARRARSVSVSVSGSQGGKAGGSKAEGAGEAELLRGEGSSVLLRDLFE